LRVIGPRGGKKKIDEVVKVDATESDFGDPDVRYELVDGTAEGRAFSSCDRRAGARSCSTTS